MGLFHMFTTAANKEKNIVGDAIFQWSRMNISNFL